MLTSASTSWTRVFGSTSTLPMPPTAIRARDWLSVTSHSPCLSRACVTATARSPIGPPAVDAPGGGPPCDGHPAPATAPARPLPPSIASVWRCAPREQRLSGGPAARRPARDGAARRASSRVPRHPDRARPCRPRVGVVAAVAVVVVHRRASRAASCRDAVDTHRRGGEPGSRGDLRAVIPSTSQKHQRLAIGLGQRLDEGEGFTSARSGVASCAARSSGSSTVVAAWRWKSMARLRAIAVSQPPNAAGSRSPASQFQAVRKTSWTRSSTSPRGTRAGADRESRRRSAHRRANAVFVAVLRRPREACRLLRRAMWRTAPASCQPHGPARLRGHPLLNGTCQ